MLVFWNHHYNFNRGNFFVALCPQGLKQLWPYFDKCGHWQISPPSLSAVCNSYKEGYNAFNIPVVKTLPSRLFKKVIGIKVANLIQTYLTNIKRYNIKKEILGWAKMGCGYPKTIFELNCFPIAMNFDHGVGHIPFQITAHHCQ